MIPHESLEEELVKYNRIIIAGLNYYIEQHSRQLDVYKDEQSIALCKLFITYNESLKNDVARLYEKKRLSTLKRWFRDISEIAVASLDVHYQRYIEEQTGYKTELFEKFYRRISKMLEKEKITTDNQYREAALMIDILSFRNDSDQVIRQLDKMMFDYCSKKTRK